MDRDDIIRMARQAGLGDLGGSSLKHVIEAENDIIDDYERLAAVVAAAEREKVAQWMMARGYATGHGDSIEDLLQELDWQVQERERESEGARVDASWASCTAAIRARVKQ